LQLVPDIGIRGSGVIYKKIGPIVIGKVFGVRLGILRFDVIHKKSWPTSQNTAWSMAHSVRNIIHKAYLVGMCSDNLGIEFLTVIFELKKTKVYGNIL
jgi:hypothetical protein